MREVWSGKTWELRSAVVVNDSAQLIALYTPPKSEALVAVSRDGRHLRMPTEEWSLQPALTFDSGLLGLHVPGTQHSILVIFNPPPGGAPWYINLESDLQRTDGGFEYEEHVLDILVEADLATWRWKDEDELAEAVELGLFTAPQAAEFRAEGESALEWLLSRRPPYDRDWPGWRPA
jgi:hypothetical protein